MSKPLVTIAIPTYNRADKYLKDALTSALNQTYEHIEILVSDNCSNDHTPDLVQSFKDSRIKYFRQTKNLGMLGNMNFLVEQANGDYMLMLHDDDVIDNDMIEACIKAANYKSGYGWILTGSRYMDEEGNILSEWENNSNGVSQEQYILNWYNKKVRSYLCCSLYGVDALRRAGGFEMKYNLFNDVAAQLKCAASHGRIDVKPAKAGYRSHSGTITNNSEIKEWCESSLAVLELASSLAGKKSEEVYSIGHKTSSDRMYRLADKAEKRTDKFKAYYTVFTYFKRIPPKKYCNSLIPFSGQILHPRNTIGQLKKFLINSS
jgi:glycosyltransferase involved in cell wall biosynthesis